MFLLDLLINEGRPRYFSCWRMTCAPNLALISSYIARGVFLLKKRVVLALLSCWPEAALYTKNMHCNSLHSSNGARQNTKLSSAKNRWEIFGALQHTATPCIACLHAA